jgi:hypothetical protein
LYNASGRTLFLDGLVIQSGTGEFHELAAGLSLEVGSFIALGLNGDTAINGGVSLDYVYDHIVLSNEEDELSVWIFDETPTGNTSTMIERVYWEDGGDFPAGVGTSMVLEPLFLTALENDDGANWCEASESWGEGTELGSPGEANSPCASYDHDGDGFSAVEDDCDDTDSAVYFGAPEIDPAVDNDCDGDPEQGPTAAAVEGASSNAQECGTVLLDGTGSFDPDGDTDLTYEWSLVSAPAASTLTSAALFDAMTDSASMVPDAAGTYTVSLTVRDSGDAASIPATLVITVTARTSNAAPVADGGAHQTETGIVECTPSGGSFNCPACGDYEYTLDGSASSDSDGDGLSYFWNISSGTGRVYNRWSVSTKVIVSGPRPSYDTSDDEFVPATNTVFVDLLVTDCMGATSTVDTVALAYTCDGEED